MLPIGAAVAGVVAVAVAVAVVVNAIVAGFADSIVGAVERFLTCLNLEHDFLIAVVVAVIVFLDVFDNRSLFYPSV